MQCIEQSYWNHTLWDREALAGEGNRTSVLLCKSGHVCNEPLRTLEAARCELYPILGSYPGQTISSVLEGEKGGVINFDCVLPYLMVACLEGSSEESEVTMSAIPAISELAVTQRSPGADIELNADPSPNEARPLQWYDVGGLTFSF